MRDELESLLAEQVAYYRARAPEYEAGALPFAGGDELLDALDEFRPTGRILELACGPGSWTPRLLRDADSVTAVDSSPEMLARAAERAGGDERLILVEADLFRWLPEARYDVVFFGFWLSHVPLELFDAFWGTVEAALEPGGRVLFLDDAYRTPDELVHGPDSSTIRRRLEDGTPVRAVKVAHTAAGLECRLRGLGWDIAVRQTAGPFFWGAGGRASG